MYIIYIKAYTTKKSILKIKGEKIEKLSDVDIYRQRYIASYFSLITTIRLLIVNSVTEKLRKS